MVPTSVLLAAVLASYAVIVTLVLAVLREFGGRVDARFDAVAARFDSVDQRFDSVDQRFDRVDARLDRLDVRLESQGDDIAGLRAAMAGVDARLTTLERP